jgi:hypothetical protein
MRLIACVMERGAIRKSLTHLGLPPHPAAAANAGTSPGPWEQQFETMASAAPRSKRLVSTSIRDLPTKRALLRPAARGK